MTYLNPTTARANELARLIRRLRSSPKLWDGPDQERVTALIVRAKARMESHYERDRAASRAERSPKNQETGSRAWYAKPPGAVYAEGPFRFDYPLSERKFREEARRYYGVERLTGFAVWPTND